MTGSRVSSETSSQFISQMKSALDTIEQLMPHWEQGWWYMVDRPNAADTLARLESESEALNCLSQILEDQTPVNPTTIVASAARRSVEALCGYVERIEGMGYVEASDVLREAIGTDIDQLNEVDPVYEFLEYVISTVLDDVQESSDTARRFEWAIIGRENDPNIVNAQGQIVFGSQSSSTQYFIPVESLADASALNWCTEFAEDAANTIVSAIDEIEDSDEADEDLGAVDRTVITDAVLRRSVALVILGHMHPQTHEKYEQAAILAGEVLEDTQFSLNNNEEVDLNYVKEVCSDFLGSARAAAAECCASAALEDCLNALLERQ